MFGFFFCQQDGGGGGFTLRDIVPLFSRLDSGKHLIVCCHKQVTHPFFLIKASQLHVLDFMPVYFTWSSHIPTVHRTSKQNQNLLSFFRPSEGQPRLCVSSPDTTASSRLAPCTLLLEHLRISVVPPSFTISCCWLPACQADRQTNY